MGARAHARRPLLIYLVIWLVIWAQKLWCRSNLCRRACNRGKGISKQTQPLIDFCIANSERRLEADNIAKHAAAQRNQAAFVALRDQGLCECRIGRAACAIFHQFKRDHRAALAADIADQLRIEALQLAQLRGLF